MKKQNVTLRSGHPNHKPIPVTQKYKPYYDMGRFPVYFREGIEYAFVDIFRYHLSTPARSVDDVLQVAAEDVKRLFCRQFTFRQEDQVLVMQEDDKIAYLEADKKIVLDCAGVRSELDEVPVVLDGVLFVPVEGLMVTGFGRNADWQKTYIAEGDYLGISVNDDLFPSIQFVKDLAVYSDKKYGIARELYYYEQANDLVPYRAYIPTKNSPENPSRVLVWLHGADPASTVDQDPDRAFYQFETLAEKYNMISLSVTGYSFGFYGAGNPMMMPELEAEEEKPYMSLCENEPLAALEQICRNYHVDRDHIFVAGNSMGGCGTVWEALRHPDIFRALAPCGSFTTHDIPSMDWTPIRGKKLLFMCGTENIGFDNTFRIVREFNACGVEASACIVPGGVHDDGWVYALPDIFKFFADIE